VCTNDNLIEVMMKHSVCSIPHDKFDEFWISMQNIGNVCKNVRADPIRPGNVRCEIRKSKQHQYVCPRCNGEFYMKDPV